MKIDRRTFLTTGAMGVTALAFGTQARGYQQVAAAIVNKKARVITHRLKENGNFPNSRIPVLIYQGALNLPASDPAAAVEAVVHANRWGNDWRNGIFDYHHYHSTAHEALLVYGGSAKVQLGGEGGVTETINAGDVISIPAGVGHRNLGSTSDFHVVGAYPPDQNVDMKYGRPGERPGADQNIARLGMPATDPVFGGDGPLLEHWRGQS